jgi:S1-C subfamily serine protease
VDEDEATILSVDPEHDLCLLNAPTLDTPPIVMGVANLGEMVLSVGHPLVLDDALLFGRVCKITDDKIYTDQHGTSGVSGSALFNTDGELLGIIHSVMGKKDCGSWFTIAMPAVSLQKILATALRIVQPTPEEIVKFGGTNETSQESMATPQGSSRKGS